MNFCSEKWKEEKFLYKNIAAGLFETMEQCGLDERKLGITFTADFLSKNGNVMESCLDHI